MEQQLTLAAIRAQATEDGTWVNGPFEAIVKNAKAGQAPGGGQKGKPSKCSLVDPRDPNVVIGASWFSGNFLKYEDKVIRVSGKSTKVSVYRGSEEVNFGKETIVDIVGNAPEQAGPCEQPRSSAGPRDDSRGGGGPAPSAAKPHDDPVTHFHKEMKKISLLLIHALQYTDDVEAKVPFDLSADQRQALTSSIFITAKDRGLLEKPPAPRAVRPEVKAGEWNGFEPYVAPKPDPAALEEQERKRREALEAEALRLQEEAKRRQTAHQENLDEDVPF